MENMVNPESNPWRGRRVFLTGHTGFKGGWLALWLAKLGATVRGYALDPSNQPSLFHSANIGSVVEDLRGDICDFPALQAAITGFRPEVIFHLAAQPLVRHSYADPLGTYATNVLGTAHLLEAVRKTPCVRAVVCITTDKCYQAPESIHAHRETDPLGGNDPYSSSKACAELVAAAYRNSFFPISRFSHHQVALATVRAGNVIGGGDWSQDRLIPDLIRGFSSGRQVFIRYPGAIRPWQHVLEPLHGYMLLAERLLQGHTQFASAFNFGPARGDAWPVQRVATQLANLWGHGAAWTPQTGATLEEAPFLMLDSSKAHAELHWQPRLTIESALKWTVDWYQSCLRGEPMQEATRQQIQAYEQLPARPATDAGAFSLEL